MTKYDNGGANDGDLVTISRGEQALTARVQASPVNPGRLYFQSFSSDSASLARPVDYFLSFGWELTVMERALVPTPTVPGIYVDKDGDYWALLQNGDWAFILGSDGAEAREAASEQPPARRRLPLTQMIPAPSEASK